MTELALAPILLPLAMAVVQMILKNMTPSPRLERASSLGMIVPGLGLIGLVLALAPGTSLAPVREGVVGTWPGSFGISWALDGPGWSMLVLCLMIVVPVWMQARADGLAKPGFNLVLLVQLAAMFSAIMTRDLFQLFVCLEILGITAYLQIASGKQGSALSAALNYLFVSAFSMLLYLVGLFMLYRSSGSLAYQDIARHLADAAGKGDYSTSLALALLWTAILVRSATVPCHGWLPAAHARAPHAVSALLSGLLLKVPLLAFALFWITLPGQENTGQILSALGFLSALLGGAMALLQRDAKRLLAWTTIGQIGGIVVCLALIPLWGAGSTQRMLLLGAALIQIFAHAWVKALLFLATGTVAALLGSRDLHQRHGRTGPRVLQVVALAGLGVMLGFPFLSSYAGKMASSIALGGSWQYWLLLIAGVPAAAAYCKLARLYGTGSRAYAAPVEQGKAAMAWRVAAMVLLLLPCLGASLILPALLAPALGKTATATLVWTLPGAKDIVSLLLVPVLGYLLYRLSMSTRGKVFAARMRGRIMSHGLHYVLMLAAALVLALGA